MSDNSTLRIQTTGTWASELRDLSDEQLQHLRDNITTTVEKSQFDAEAHLVLNDPRGETTVIFGRHIVGYVVSPRR